MERLGHHRVGEHGQDGTARECEDDRNVRGDAESRTT
jgi:hypothetical protein